MSEIRTFCRICNAACGIIVTVEGDTVLRVIGDRDHPVSAGYSCAKGRALPALHHHPDRLEQPQLRVGGGATGSDRVAEPVSWDVLLDDLGDRLRGILRTHGPEGIAVYFGTASAFDATAGRSAGQFLRAIGSRQKYSSLTVDSVAKALVAELLGGWSGLVPVWDEQRCGLLLLIGINPVVSHGHSNGISNPRTRLRAQRERGELWVVDPRRTESATLATRHLQSRPGSDHVLVGHLVRELLRDGADEEFLAAHAVDVAELAVAVEPYDSHRTARETGLPAEAVAELLAAVRRAGRISVLTGTGVDMSAAGNVTEWLVWALGVVTGSFDRPGGMWFNPGYLVRSDLRPRPPAPPEGKVRPGPASRPHLVARFGERPAAALVPEIEAGNVAAVVVVGANLMTALPDSLRTRAALSSLDVLVVADVVETETTELATHVLPCVGQLERADVSYGIDTFQSAVMSHYTPAVVPPVASRRPLWWSLGKIAEQLGVELVPGLDLDTATDDDLLEPVLDGSIDGAALRAEPTAVVASGPVFGWVTDTVLPAGRWRLAPTVLVAQLRLLTERLPFPLVLTPHRNLATMNSQLRDVSGVHPEVWIHPADAAAAGIVDGLLVTVTGEHGATTGRARVSHDIRPGVVSMPHGWRTPDVGRLTSGESDLDSLTGMVLQSGLPVRLSPG